MCVCVCRPMVCVCPHLCSSQGLAISPPVVILDDARVIPGWTTDSTPDSLHNDAGFLHIFKQEGKFVKVRCTLNFCYSILQ